ncbi:MAG TPA: hypothetical protein PLA50_00135, partial [Bacteroidia bacterium]|nr:hypothetical protein [Bacteroidia bacterium]
MEPDAAEDECRMRSASYSLSWEENLNDAEEETAGQRGVEEAPWFPGYIGTCHDFSERARIEEEWLSACAFRMDIEKYRSRTWDEERQRKADEILNGGSLFEDAMDNLAAMNSLQSFLTGFVERRLPQIAKQRIAARRLFLSVCRVEVPKPLQDDAVVKSWVEEFLPDLAIGERFIRERLKESEMATIDRIEGLIVNDEPLPEIIRDSALMAVCRKYWSIQLGRDDCWGIPSIQSALINYYKTNGFSEILSQYEEAKESSRRQLFKHAAELVLGRGFEKSEFNPEEAMLRTAIIGDPYAARNCEGCVDYLFDGMGDRGWRFLHDLANEVKKAEERKHRVKTDFHMLVMAKYWVDPHCPLWLMSKGAIQDACRALSIGGEWSDTRVDERLRKRALVQCRRQPIRGVRITRNESGDGCEIVGFEVLKAVFSQLENLEDIEAEVEAWG